MSGVFYDVDVPAWVTIRVRAATALDALTVVRTLPMFFIDVNDDGEVPDGVTLAPGGSVYPTPKHRLPEVALSDVRQAATEDDDD